MNKKIVNKILIIDHSKMNRILLKKMLDPYYSILEAQNGQEALTILEKEFENIGLIILEPLLPVMNGLTFLEKKSQDKRLQSIPVLVTTTEQDHNIEKKCLELGASDFMRKPYDPLIASLHIKNHMEHSHQVYSDQKYVTDLFEKYVDPLVVKDMLNTGSPAEEQLKGTSADLTVMFADISGFTRIAEFLPPDRLISFLNDCFSLTDSCIKKYGGTLDKFIGDCTMAFWGAPLPCEDSSYLACCAAQDILMNLPNISSKHHFSDLSLSYSIGIHRGPAVVGNIGSYNRMTYTAIGDTVNIASRLQNLAKPNTIYISRRVADDLVLRADVTSLGSFLLKGRSSELEVLTLNQILK